jgi:hypothetical protein
MAELFKELVVCRRGPWFESVMMKTHLYIFHLVFESCKSRIYLYKFYFPMVYSKLQSVKND